MANKPVYYWDACLFYEWLGEQGNWIIVGIQGEIYPCKPDIFERTYDPA